MDSPYTRQQRANNKPLRIRDLTTDYRADGSSVSFDLGTMIQRIITRKKVTLSLRELQADDVSFVRSSPIVSVK
jgi:hypothetical protein